MGRWRSSRASLEKGKFTDRLMRSLIGIFGLGASKASTGRPSEGTNAGQLI